MDTLSGTPGNGHNVTSLKLYEEKSPAGSGLLTAQPMLVGPGCYDKTPRTGGLRSQN